eukprot:5334959-Pyramimonas_sp.AAC.1
MSKSDQVVTTCPRVTGPPSIEGSGCCTLCFALFLPRFLLNPTKPTLNPIKLTINSTKPRLNPSRTLMFSPRHEAGKAHLHEAGEGAHAHVAEEVARRLAQTAAHLEHRQLLRRRRQLEVLVQRDAALVLLRRIVRVLPASNGGLEADVDAQVDASHALADLELLLRVHVAPPRVVARPDGQRRRHLSPR